MFRILDARRSGQQDEAMAGRDSASHVLGRLKRIPCAKGYQPLGALVTAYILNVA